MDLGGLIPLGEKAPLREVGSVHPLNATDVWRRAKQGFPWTCELVDGCPVAFRPRRGDEFDGEPGKREQRAHGKRDDGE